MNFIGNKLQTLKIYKYCDQNADILIEQVKLNFFDNLSLVLNV